MFKKRVQIDPDGYLMFDGLRITDNDFAKSLLKNIRTENNLFFTKMNGEDILVEAFDEPLIVRNIHHVESGQWLLQFPYDYTIKFDLSKLQLDEWDRFCGRTDEGVPFAFSRAAQGEFFKLLEDFDDDSITADGRRIRVPSKYEAAESISDPSFWSKHYEAQETPWDMGEASPVLKQALLQLKLPRQRVVVLGAGRGHDAAHFAQAGHVVTAVDFSSDAKSEFEKLYSEQRDLTYKVEDAFKLNPPPNLKYDLVFDHTFFCAVEPRRRKEVVSLWKRLLVENGHLLAVFFVMDKIDGPPYGATEWELHQLLKKDFDLLYWTRTQASIPRRLGKELVVYAKKKG